MKVEMPRPLMEVMPPYMDRVISEESVKPDALQEHEQHFRLILLLSPPSATKTARDFKPVLHSFSTVVVGVCEPTGFERPPRDTRVKVPTNNNNGRPRKNSLDYGANVSCFVFPIDRIKPHIKYIFVGGCLPHLNSYDAWGYLTRERLYEALRQDDGRICRDRCIPIANLRLDGAHLDMLGTMHFSLYCNIKPSPSCSLDTYRAEDLIIFRLQLLRKVVKRVTENDDSEISCCRESFVDFDALSAFVLQISTGVFKTIYETKLRDRLKRCTTHEDFVHTYIELFGHHPSSKRTGASYQQQIAKAVSFFEKELLRHRLEGAHFLNLKRMLDYLVRHWTDCPTTLYALRVQTQLILQRNTKDVQALAEYRKDLIPLKEHLIAIPFELYLRAIGTAQTGFASAFNGCRPRVTIIDGFALVEYRQLAQIIAENFDNQLNMYRSPELWNAAVALVRKQLKDISPRVGDLMIELAHEIRGAQVTKDMTHVATTGQVVVSKVLKEIKTTIQQRSEVAKHNWNVKTMNEFVEKNMPACIRQMHKMNHITHQQRFPYAAAMWRSGIPLDVVQEKWGYSLEIYYRTKGASSVENMIMGVLRDFECTYKRFDKNPTYREMSCATMESNGFCPFTKEFLYKDAARQKCATELTVETQKISAVYKPSFYIQVKLDRNKPQ